MSLVDIYVGNSVTPRPALQNQDVGPHCVGLTQVRRRGFATSDAQDSIKTLTLTRNVDARPVNCGAIKEQS